ncbi:MAG: hypothetical protein JWN02_1934 [Acidobacteria bacterium]|nr:hypothetical protein [Acidobacteriota bacterium]
MVDITNPTNQFHPYQPVDAMPNSEKPAGGLGGMLKNLGIDTSNLGSVGDTVKNMDVRGSFDKARSYARSNPALVLGGLAAAVIGAGLLRRRTV